MTTFDNRDKAFENKFAHDEEMKFKVNSRATRLLGLWAAEKMGKTGTDADSYALSLLEEGMKRPGNDDVIAKVVGDVPGTSAKDIALLMEDMIKAARQQIMEGN